VLEDWIARWARDPKRTERVVRPGTDLRGTRQSLRTHRQISGPLTPFWTMKIRGPGSTSTYRPHWAFKVPLQPQITRIESTKCKCSAGEEAPWYIALYCTDGAEHRQHLRANERVNYQQPIWTNRREKMFSEWMICSGRLGQFSLAMRLLYN